MGRLLAEGLGGIHAAAWSGDADAVDETSRDGCHGRGRLLGQRFGASQPPNLNVRSFPTPPPTSNLSSPTTQHPITPAHLDTSTSAHLHTCTRSNLHTCIGAQVHTFNHFGSYAARCVHGSSRCGSRSCCGSGSSSRRRLVRNLVLPTYPTLVFVFPLSLHASMSSPSWRAKP